MAADMFISYFSFCDCSCSTEGVSMKKYYRYIDSSNIYILHILYI